MTFIPLTQPYNLTNAQFTIGDDEYSQAVSRVEFTPTTRTTEWIGISGHTITSVQPATWTCTVGYAQDLDPDGLTRFLHDHEGEVFDCTFVPLENGPTIEATLQLSAARIGGSAGADLAVGEATLGVQGKPQFVDVIAS